MTNIIILLAVMLTLVSGIVRYACAYDGDVDFLAPYLTVDPETGKLITVDPGNDPALSQHPPTPPVSASVPTIAGTTDAGQPVDSETLAFPVVTIVTGTTLAFIAIVIAVAVIKRKQNLSAPRT